jgi:uncharacterized protein
MKFEWDENKRQLNLAKHRIDFLDVIPMFDVRCVTEELPYADELRWKSIGLIDGREIAVIYTRRNERIRLISARRARNYERRTYRQLYP